MRQISTRIWQDWKALATLSGVIILMAGLTLIIAGRNHLYDPSLYYQYAQNIFAGQVPYCDFPLEYPPLALLSMVIPLLLTGGKTTHLYVYAGLFALQILIFSCICVIILAQFNPELRLDKTTRHYILRYGIFLVLLSPLLLWRYDLFPGLISLLALASTISFPIGSGIFLAIGFTAKLYPILGLPFWVIFYLLKRQYRNLKSFLIGFFGVVLLAIAPFLLKCPSQFYESIRFHQLRGIQVSSIPANLLLLGHQFANVKLDITKSYGAEHLRTPLAEPLLKIFPMIFILLYMLLVLSFIHTLTLHTKTRGAMDDDSSLLSLDFQVLIGYFILAISLFIVTNKVFSPQYLMWLAPLVPLLSRNLQKSFFFVCLVHSIVYPFLYNGLVKLETIPILTLTFGNILMIYFTFQLLVNCLFSSKSSSNLT